MSRQSPFGTGVLVPEELLVFSLCVIYAEVGSNTDEGMPQRKRIDELAQ